MNKKVSEDENGSKVWTHKEKYPTNFHYIFPS